MARPIRILIVDDSSTNRLLCKRMLQNDPRVQVIGEAINGKSGVEQTGILKPDLVLMDIVMPVMDGLEATAEIMHAFPRPIVLISDLADKQANLNFKVLQAGALELIPKLSQSQAQNAELKEQFIHKLCLLAEIPVVTRYRSLNARPVFPVAVPPVMEGGKRFKVVCIGASTGGPPAIAKILTALSGRAPWPVIIVQHMAPDFIGGMAKWLSETTGFPTEIAVHGMLPQPGRAYLAPDNKHLLFDGNRIVLDGGPPHFGFRPAVNKLFASVAAGRTAARETLAVLLTGMGEDGAVGLGQIRNAGGYTLAQDEATSVVYGMPKAAWDMGAAMEVLPVDQIAWRLLALSAVTQPLSSAG